MRGKLVSVYVFAAVSGITPADAGKTHHKILGLRTVKDHPRGCGENVEHERGYHLPMGSPPRMRGKLFCSVIGCSACRITPADAGKTRKGL